MDQARGASDGVQFAHGMNMLAESLDVLGGVDVTELPGVGLEEHVLSLLASTRRLGAVQAAVTDRFATTGAWADSGARTARAWITSHSNEPPGRAGAVIETGARMRAHPVMAASMSAGLVSAAHLEVLAKAVVAYPRLRGELREAEGMLVDLAQAATPRRFEAELTAICHQLDPTAVEADERQRDSEAYLHLSPISHGMWRLDGLLPAEVGTHLSALLTAARRRLRAEAKQQDTPDADTPDLDTPDADTPDLGEVIGTDVFGNPIHAHETPEQAMDNRFTSRSQVDALRKLLSLIAPATNPDGTIALPSVNGARPVVHLTIDIESLLDDTRDKAAGWLERFGVPSTVISATKAGLLACDATIEPMIIKDGRLVATLPSLQTVPAHLRKAVLMRDGCCRINSCTAPIDEVHHLIYLSHGGPTTMDNLAGLCWYHHHLIHHSHWTLTGDANHNLTLTNTHTGDTWTNRPPQKVDYRKRKERKRE